jgi:hypothetical protein
MNKEKLLFIGKVTLAHVLTYFICGMIAMTINNYAEHMEAIGLKNMEELNGLLIILGQLTRGILFGIVIWWIKDSIIGKKMAWFKLWVILVVVGIISVYAPAPASIEGFLYLIPGEPVPLATKIGSILEVTIQPLLFSIIVTYQKKKSGKEKINASA